MREPPIKNPLSVAVRDAMEGEQSELLQQTVLNEDGSITVHLPIIRGDTPNRRGNVQAHIAAWRLNTRTLAISIAEKTGGVKSVDDIMKMLHDEFKAEVADPLGAGETPTIDDGSMIILPPGATKQ